MHAQPPRTLKRLLKQYGQELIDDPRRTEALLRDHCGQHTREIFVLVNAQKQRVPNELVAAPAWMPRQATYSRLSRILQTKLALTEDAADWAVAAWAAALDLDAPPKGDGWGWLPGQSRTPASTPTKKARNKKRQTTPSSVQYPKESARSATRQAKERAAHLEMGWATPRILLWRLTQYLKMPQVWASLLPWVALFTATLFLLAVIYWASTSRSGGENGSLATVYGTPMAGRNAESSGANNGASGTSVDTNVTPLPELPAPPSEYLATVILLPTWANVNDTVITLNVRELPTVDSNILNFLPAGEPVEVVAFSADGQWSQIERPQKGWVSNDFLLFNIEDALHSSVQIDVQLRRVQSYEIAVRAAPQANAEVTETLSPDETVIVAATLGEPATWYHIADPVVGWVAANDLTSELP